MSGKYQAYTDYKTSGVEWLDEVPFHWHSIAIKYMALSKESLFLDGDWIESKDISDSGIRYITTGNVGEGKYKEQGMGFITEKKFEQLNCTEVFPHDVLISRLNNPIGRACEVPDLRSRIVTSVDNVIFRPDPEYLKNYLIYLFSSRDYFKHTSNLARGATMQRISRGLLGNIRIVVPPVNEQQQIANFLDHETAKIDTLIDKQQQLIKLLKEKRQAVISHAVTKGLNPNAPMKDSGVEWLGEVPEHWGISQFRYLMVGGTRNGLYKSEGFKSEMGYPFIQMGEAFAKRVFEGNTKDRVLCNDIEISNWGLQEGDLLFARRSIVLEGSGKCTRIGKIIEPHVFESSMIRVRLIPELVIPAYIHSLLDSKVIRAHLLSTTKTVTISGIDSMQLKALKILIPPIEEQDSICTYIEEVTKSIDATIEKVISSIEFLIERRTALISAAVTGKIDVRNFKAGDTHVA